MLPLEGIRVLDLSEILPGPYATLMLADFGAEVIKIERPGGDYVRSIGPFINGISARHLLLNRNKKSIVLNMKSKEEREIFYKLAEKSDVVVEGFRPGVVDRLGIGYEAISKINPMIIYCSISSYGQSGPYRNFTGHDVNFCGIAGILDMTGERGRCPVVPGLLLGDMAGGGLMAVIGILIALRARELSGRGQYIDISMLDGVVSTLNAFVGDYFATDRSPTRGQPAETRMLGYACYRVYQTKGESYVALGAFAEAEWSNFCHSVGRNDLIELQFVPEKQGELMAEVQQIFLTRTGAEWVKELSAVGVPISSVNTLAEALSDPHVLHRQMVTEIEHPTVGRVKQLGIPIKLTSTPGRVRMPAPALGEHTSEILREFGISA